MKFGTREICDVVFKSYAGGMVGGQQFEKGEPVIMFDTLKASSMEGSSTTVYAQGGRGNAKLVGWEGDREVKFTMEDALISAEGIAVLTGAGLIKADGGQEIVVPRQETVSAECLAIGKISLDLEAAGHVTTENPLADGMDVYGFLVDGDDVVRLGKGTVTETGVEFAHLAAKVGSSYIVKVSFYQKRTSGATSIQITPDKFAGFYRIEAVTLGRFQDGRDFPLAITIPKAKVQSNFSFSFSPTGDPGSFNFEIEAFPAIPYDNMTQKMFAVMDMITE